MPGRVKRILISKLLPRVEKKQDTDASFQFPVSSPPQEKEYEEYVER